MAQWMRHWSTVLAASQGGQHPQLELDVSTVNFCQDSMPRAAKEGSEDRREPLLFFWLVAVGFDF